MTRITRDPLFRRFVSTCIFAAAFVWVAIEFFGVDADVVWRFLIGSILLVLAMIFLAWLASLVLVRLRGRKSDFLDGGDDQGLDDEDS